MFCNNGLCSNNSTNFNNNCGCCNNCGNNSCGCNSCNNSCGCNSRNNSCGCSRSNFGCGWYCCPNSMRLTMPVIPPTTPPIATVNLGHFNTAGAPAIGANAVIPLTLARQVGTDITSSGTGALLQPGTYEIDFALTGASATTGTTTVGAQLNGVNLPAFSQSTNVATENALYNLSGVGTLSVTTPNSILNLVNLGANSQNFTDVNLVVRKIA
ncbi:MAG: hypothetical protein K2J89_06250 [Clostridia bacterium]|nr:hypothetical protein [Clostridia bacterium]